MSFSPHANLPLPQYLSHTLSPLLPIFTDSLPSSTRSAQRTLSTAADELYLVGRMMSSLGLYSENEDADELGERELLFMAVPWVLGEVEGRRGVVREDSGLGGGIRGARGDGRDGGEEGMEGMEQVGGVRMDGRAGAVRRSDVSLPSGFITHGAFGSSSAFGPGDDLGTKQAESQPRAEQAGSNCEV